MSAVAVLILGLALLLIWSGVTGKPLISSIQSVLSGSKSESA